MKRKVSYYRGMGDALNSSTSTTTPEPTPITENQAVTSFTGGLYLTSDTPYITIGDEPDHSLPLLDLSKYLSANDYQNMFQQLRYLPRIQLGDFITAQGNSGISQTADGDYRPMLRRALFNLFNVANADEVQKQGIDPWTWETKKNQAYALSLQPQHVQAQSGIIFQPAQIQSAVDRATQIAIAYGKLPPIASQTLELQRQAAIKGLLSLGEFDAAQQIITTYSNLDPAITAALTDPSKIGYIPPDLAATVADGTPVA